VITRDQFGKAIRDGTAADHVHTIRVKTGDAAFLPAGRLHALGGGNLLIEIQQNSDTTYRVFDWNRVDDTGKQRQLHVDQALQCIDFTDVRPLCCLSKANCCFVTIIRDPEVESRFTARDCSS